MNVRLIHTSMGHRGALYALAPGREPGTFLSVGSDGWLVAWNAADPENGRLIASVESQVYALCVLPGESPVFVCGNMNGGIHWIHPADESKNRNIQHHKKGVYDLLAVGPHLYSAGGDGLLTRWSIAEQRSLESLQLSAHSLRCIAYAPARGELAVGAADHSIYLLDAETLSVRERIAEAHDPTIFCLQYAPGERLLLSGGRDAMLRVWDLEDGNRCVSEQPAHLFTINHLVFSPDGTLFATASRDKTIKIWDTASFQLLKVIDTLRHGGHINSVNRLLWTKDFLVSCGDDRAVKWWEITK